MLKSYKEWSSQLKEMTGVNPQWVRGGRHEEQWKNEEVKKAFDKVSMAVNSAFESVLKAMPQAPEKQPVAPSAPTPPPLPKEEPKAPAGLTQPYRRLAGQSWKTASGNAPGQDNPALAAPKPNSWKPMTRWVGAGFEHVVSENIDAMMSTIGDLKKTIEDAFKELDGKVGMASPLPPEKQPEAPAEEPRAEVPEPPAEEPTPEAKPSPPAGKLTQKTLFGDEPSGDVPVAKPDPIKPVDLPKPKDPIRKNNKAASADVLGELLRTKPEAKQELEKIMATLTPEPGKKSSVDRVVKLKILETLHKLDPEYGWLNLIGNNKWRSDHVMPVLEKALKGGSGVVSVRPARKKVVPSPQPMPESAPPRLNRRDGEGMSDYAAWAKRQNQADMRGDHAESPGEPVNEGADSPCEPNECSSSGSASKRSGKSSRNASSSRRAALTPS